jgi:hypothetical protein
VRETYSFRFLDVKASEASKRAEASVAIAGGTATGAAAATTVATVATISSELGGTALCCSSQSFRYAFDRRAVVRKHTQGQDEQ